MEEIQRNIALFHTISKREVSLIEINGTNLNKCCKCTILKKINVLFIIYLSLGKYSFSFDNFLKHTAKVSRIE